MSRVTEAETTMRQANLGILLPSMTFRLLLREHWVAFIDHYPNSQTMQNLVGMETLATSLQQISVT